jgi:hypothetical protein
MVIKLFLVWATLFISTHAAGGWEDFANNLATDLAPILQLFGEQVTLQYLTESTSVLDCIIFAMAPLGVLTAVVSVIRICGDGVLKAFIGRAQEGSGVAEVALCSSTGKDIADLYQHGVITRVFGRPHILEVVHTPHQECSNSEDRIAPGGLFTFDEYQLIGRGQSEWVIDGLDSSQSKQILPKDTLNPNLRLNLGFKRPARWILASLAAFAVALQSSMIVFAIWARSIRKLPMETGSLSSYALPMTVVGTAVLCFGMLMCALMIERSTVEETFVRKLPTKRESSSKATSVTDESPPSTLYWIQPGGQVIGDQTFHSFAYSDERDPLRCYTKSWRSREDSEGKLTWAASALTIVGFIIQFVGLRNMHPSVSVYQIGCVLLMSIVRASIRTGRFDESKNMAKILASGSNGSANQENDASNDHDRLSGPEQDLTGHELDYVAFEMARNQMDSSILGSFEGIGDDRWCLSPWSTSNTCDANQRTATVGNSNFVFGILDKLLTREQIEVPHSNNAGNLIWRYRARLGQLTSSPASQQWPASMVKGRSAAAAAFSAINQAMTLLPPSTLPPSTLLTPSDQCHHWGLLLVPFDCGINIKASSDPACQLRRDDMFLSSGKACFHLELDELSWRVDPYEIEAAVALMAWSQRQPLSPLQIICACVPEDNRSEIPRHYCSFQQWDCAGTAFHQLVEHRLDFKFMSTEYATHHNKSADSFRNSYPQMTPSMRGSMRGWNAVPWKRLGIPSRLTTYCAHVGGFVDLTCAQDLYGYFLLQILRASDKALGDSDFVKTEKGYGIRNSKVNKLVDGFVESGLGTKYDAVRCILPIVAASDCPSPMKDAIGAVLKSVKEAIKSERYGDATSELNWLADLLVYESDTEHVRQWCVLKSCLYRCDLWEGHAQNGQSFGQSLLHDIVLIDFLRPDSETEKFARDLFLRLWQMFCDDNLIPINWSWALYLQRSPEPIDELYSECDFNSCLDTNDAYGALICLPSLVRELDGERFVMLLEKEESSWRLVIQYFLSFEPELIHFKYEGRDTLSLACEYGSVEIVRWLLERLTTRKLKRLLTQEDEVLCETPVHYAIKYGQKETIRALGPELLRYWYSECCRFPGETQRYLDDNFGDLLGSKDAQSGTWDSEDGTGRAKRTAENDPIVASREEMWIALKNSLVPPDLLNITTTQTHT